ncbi:hypothetical protein ASF43_12105 [Pseudorhodoferax sp. Leaf267]|nr:hypothetical protein ASF43_12105 [Pseudorhodoferax sp. Leaf267]
MRAALRSHCRLLLGALPLRDKVPAVLRRVSLLTVLLPTLRTNSSWLLGTWPVLGIVLTGCRRGSLIILRQRGGLRAIFTSVNAVPAFRQFLALIHQFAIHFRHRDLDQSALDEGRQFSLIRLASALIALAAFVRMDVDVRRLESDQHLALAVRRSLQICDDLDRFFADYFHVEVGVLHIVGTAPERVDGAAQERFGASSTISPARVDPTDAAEIADTAGMEVEKLLFLRLGSHDDLQKMDRRSARPSQDRKVWTGWQITPSGLQW